jgi:hypothetical protein
MAKKGTHAMNYYDTTTDGKLGQIEAALDLLRQEIAGLRRPPARPVFGIDPALCAGPLAEQLWRRLGRRKALVLRTRLSQLAEAEDGHRQRNGAGRDYVTRGHNGNGHVADAAIDFAE